MLRALSAAGRPMAVIVVDNAGDPETEVVTGRSFEGLEISRVVPGTNLGCGGGLEYGEREALKRYPQATHFWIMDDDTKAAPDALDKMLAAMEKEGAIVACPSVLDENGRIAWFPGLMDARAFRIIKKRCLLDFFLAKVGNATLKFSWACGVSFLVKRDALEKTGLHRADFWVRGDDIEFSLRHTYRGVGVYVPSAVVRHFPPFGSMESECEKDYFMLRNHAYIALRLPHGRRIFHNLPGSILRYLRVFGWHVWPLALKALVNGAMGKLGPKAPARKN